MKNRFGATYFIIFLFFPLSIIGHFNPPNAITYENDKGKFGDRIISYCKAKLIATKYNIPLLYQPFRFSELLALHTLEKVYTPDIANQFDNIIHVKNEKKLGYCFQPGTLFFTTHNFMIYSELNQNLQNQIDPSFTYYVREQTVEDIIMYSVSLPAFKDELKKLIKPIIPINSITLPNDIITVAVHIRKGNMPLAASHGNDLLPQQNQDSIPNEYRDQKWPLKFPPDDYYIEQIKNLSTLLNDTSLFVYLFTDHPNPKALMKKIKKSVDKPNITFACRTEEKSPLNVIEDFFSIKNFDCLIRSTSNYARAAQLIGDHKIIIYPEHATWISTYLFIDKVSIITHKPHTSLFEKVTFNPILLEDITCIEGLGQIKHLLANIFPYLYTEETNHSENDTPMQAFINSSNIDSLVQNVINRLTIY